MQAVAVAAAAASATLPSLPWLRRRDVHGRAAIAVECDGSLSCKFEAALCAEAEAAPPLASDPELLILAFCAAQIAAEAGAGAVVHAAGAPRQAALLAAAIDALPAPTPDGEAAGRSLVYLPRRLVATLSLDELRTLLLRLSTRDGDDTLLVVAVESKRNLDAPRSASEMGSACAALVFNQIALAAGWELCQLWSDGTARHALHVLERGTRALPAKAR